MNDTTPPLAVLDHAAGPEADERPEDKRLKGERNRTDTLVWLRRFGWLTSKMLAGLVWPTAAQGQTMARRTLGALADEKLVVARTMSNGTTVYVLSAKGARLLTEQTGTPAESGHALALGNPLHRAASNWYLIRAVQQGHRIVTEHEIATERGPCRVLRGKVADGLIVADDGLCTWVEVENAPAKSRAERAKTVSLAAECLGHATMAAIADGLWLARLAVVATNEAALRHMAASFMSAYREGSLRDAQVGDVDVCLLPVSPSLVPGEVHEGNLWWDVLVPALE